jgi:hypothetical protein
MTHSPDEVKEDLLSASSKTLPEASNAEHSHCSLHVHGQLQDRDCAIG